MKIKTSEVTPLQLNYLVAKCEKRDMYIDEDGEMCFRDGDFGDYSTDWAQGGPIIEREAFCLEPFKGRLDDWRCFDFREGHVYAGPTPLIAAMRTYVASKLGDDIDLPEELTK